MNVLIQTSIYYKVEVTIKRNYDSISAIVNIYIKKYVTFKNNKIKI